MGRQSPLPYAFAQRSEFMALSFEMRARYLWEAHEFCQEQLGQGRFADTELNRNLGILRRMMHDVAKHIAGHRRQEGAWSDASDARWPRHHKGADSEHMYDTGCYPPQMLSFPTDRESWRSALQERPEAVFDEMIAWSKTPAGQFAIGEIELEKLMSDRDTYLPHAERTTSPEPAETIAETERRGTVARQDGMGWLWDKSADGSLSDWANKLELQAVSKFLTGPSSNRRPMDRLLPELMAIEKCGEWKLLSEHLQTVSPVDASLLEKLRTSLPKSRTAI